MEFCGDENGHHVFLMFLKPREGKFKHSVYHISYTQHIYHSILFLLLSLCYMSKLANVFYSFVLISFCFDLIFCYVISFVSIILLELSEQTGGVVVGLEAQGYSCRRKRNPYSGSGCTAKINWNTRWAHSRATGNRLACCCRVPAGACPRINAIIRACSLFLFGVAH